MSAVDDVFGSDSSDNEFDRGGEDNDNADEANEGGGSSGGGAGYSMEDSDNDDNRAAGAVSSASPAEMVGGTGLSDSEDEEVEGQQPEQQQENIEDDDARQAMDADVFGTDSEDEVGPTGGTGGSAEAPAGADLDPFEDSDDDGDQQGRSRGGEEGKTLGGGGGRLSKGGSSGKGKGKKRKGGAEGSSSKKKSKTKKGDSGDNPGKKKKRRRKDGAEGDREDAGDERKKKIKKKKKKTKTKKKGKASVESSTLQDLGLESSADEAPEEEEDDDDLSEEEVEHQDEVEDLRRDDGDGKTARRSNARTKEDDDFIDDTDDNADLLKEYKNDEPEGGDHSEAEEDNDAEDKSIPRGENVMTEVLASMKKRKAQDLSTAEREQIAQEFMFKINQAAEDDEEAVQSGRPALNKLKMLKTVKATLAKKELQETFLEFDLLGVVKRWLQPYANGQLPNLTIRKEMLALMLVLPVQVDHLKRSGIGKVVMGLINCREETTQNKRVLRELVAKWNRPVYEKATTHRAMRTADDDLEAMEVNPRGRNGVRRVVTGSMSRRDGPSKNEAVGNILNAKERGLDPTKARVPFSNGYAFSKAPRSKVERHGRPSNQPVDTSSRAKLLKKMAALSRPGGKKT